MRKVLLTADINGAVGGINIWARHLYDYYSSIESAEIGLVTVPSGRKDFTKFKNSKLKRIIDGTRFYVLFIKRIARCLREQKYDVLHITSSGSYGVIRDYVLIRIAHYYGVKAIIHFHFGRIPYLKQNNNLEWKCLKKISQMADAVIVLDQSSFDSLQSVVSILYKLPNPVSPKVLKYVLNRNVIHRKKNNVLFVGQCYKEKGIYDICEACVGIPNVTLDLVGSISEDTKNDLVNKYQELNLHIHGIKPYNMVLDEMLSCSVFALPSYSEGFPNVILEAMACGCKIVASGVGAIPEMLIANNHCSAGIVVPPRDTKALRKALVSLLNDEKTEYGLIARERVEAEYSMPIVWNRLIQIWNNV